MHLGYQCEVKGYRLWNLVACKLVVSRDVSFIEPRLLKKGGRVTSSADKGKSLLPEMVEGKTIPENSHDLLTEEPLAMVEYQERFHERQEACVSH